MDTRCCPSVGRKTKAHQGFSEKGNQDILRRLHLRAWGTAKNTSTRRSRELNTKGNSLLRSHILGQGAKAHQDLLGCNEGKAGFKVCRINLTPTPIFYTILSKSTSTADTCEMDEIKCSVEEYQQFLSRHLHSSLESRWNSSHPVTPNTPSAW